MHEFNFDIVQSGLVSYKNQEFWDAAEEASWAMVHNIPGRWNMVGTAPAIYNKRVFSFARFDDHITSTIDDTDFAYRLSKFPDFRFGVGHTNIQQYHFADFSTYVKKFQCEVPHAELKGIYGSPRKVRELRDRGFPASKERETHLASNNIQPLAA